VHISEGILSAPVLVAGAVTGGVGVAIGVSRLTERNVVPTAVLSSALFVATLVKIPFGPAAVHLILSGLAGVILGWRVFPAFLVALLLQAMLGIGGFSTLGVNLLILATPGLLAYGLVRGALRNGDAGRILLRGVAAGAAAIALGAVMLAAFLMLSGREFFGVAGALLAAHVPVMAVEGFVTGAALRFLLRVRPDVFDETIGPRPDATGPQPEGTG